MRDKLVRCVYALELHCCLLHAAVVLGPVHLQHTPRAHTEKSALGRMRMIWPYSMYEGAFILIPVSTLICRPVHYVERFLGQVRNFDNTIPNIWQIKGEEKLTC